MCGGGADRSPPGAGLLGERGAAERTEAAPGGAAAVTAPGEPLIQLRTTLFPTAECGGDLQAICTSQALLLFPNRGQTEVYHLSQRDLIELNLKERDPALSCERL